MKKKPSALPLPLALCLGLCPGCGTDASLETASNLEGALWTSVEIAGMTDIRDWTHRVEIADLDSDGDADLLFANSRGYSTAHFEDSPNRVFLNRTESPGDPAFVDATHCVFPTGTALFPDATESGVVEDHSRVIKAAELNGDGFADLIVGVVYGGPSRMYLSDAGTVQAPDDEEDPCHGLPGYAESAIPTGPKNGGGSYHVGDVEPADIDGDGDLDLIVADWELDQGGAVIDPKVDRGQAGCSRDPQCANPDWAGGTVRLWENRLDEGGGFVDQPDLVAQTRCFWTWDLAVVDLDNDADIDVAAACKYGTAPAGGSTPTSDRSLILINELADGGILADRREQLALPGSYNNYSFGFGFFDGDDAIDLVTVNAGPGSGFDRPEQIFRNLGTGAFEDSPQADLLGVDDNTTRTADFDQDGLADILIGALFPSSSDGDERILFQDPESPGQFVQKGSVTDSEPDDELDFGVTSNTLDIGLVDVDGDHILDLVMTQGEVFEENKLYLGGGALEADRVPPYVARGPSHMTIIDGVVVVRARIHENKSPLRPLDFAAVTLQVCTTDGSCGEPVEMTWYGEYWWRGVAPLADGAEVASYTLSATDRSGCVATRTMIHEGPSRSVERTASCPERSSPRGDSAASTPARPGVRPR